MIQYKPKFDTVIFIDNQHHIISVFATKPIIAWKYRKNDGIIKIPTISNLHKARLLNDKNFDDIPSSKKSFKGTKGMP